MKNTGAKREAGTMTIIKTFYKADKKKPLWLIYEPGSPGMAWGKTLLVAMKNWSAKR